MKIGDCVKIFFHNGLQIDGSLDKIENNCLYVLSKTNEEIIIFNYQENVLLIKVENQINNQTSITPQPLISLNEQIIKLEETIEDDYNDLSEPIDIHLHSRKLVDLYLLKQKIEKEEVGNKIKSHEIDSTKLNNLGNYQHGLFKK